MTEDIFIGACFGGAFGLAGWLLWFVIFRFGRFPEHNDGKVITTDNDGSTEVP
jgi:hypothetical protein